MKLFEELELLEEESEASSKCTFVLRTHILLLFVDRRHRNIASSDGFFSKYSGIHILMNGISFDESFHGRQNAYFSCSKQFPLGTSLKVGRSVI